MYDLTAFQRDCLFVVAGNSGSKGLVIKEELEDYYGSDVNHGLLYPNLDELVEKGLIKKDEKDGRTNMYSITDRGKRVLEARREWENKYSES
ncbi:MAG: PadR family transcriptional regulator [Halobacteriaceae archaeon]